MNINGIKINMGTHAALMADTERLKETIKEDIEVSLDYNLLYGNPQVTISVFFREYGTYVDMYAYIEGIERSLKWSQNADVHNEVRALVSAGRYKTMKRGQVISYSRHSDRDLNMRLYQEYKSKKNPYKGKG